ncbi:MULTISPECIES: sugar ABC transporter ATP-binding protein [unclassified Oceanispirochaeta]|uniref:sugar ABC transporter ATP-binding protein n=1 Tax=unclassified Oceanispirochaeta TaxID=2635722 RepID=UPI000E098CEA|nr:MULTISPECIES: sugar ABC transporter ATP-binding protein [unclassified Oceanispirochaeta]MBF9016915.1 sugar ABC transporter ATP-binding protein [Oceanispirochaeta sp. M2]NPD73278.1 sugar ABC transporter ATP-binding protein [Oceanispirochaeta sp. M1]RDG31144.1 sugar ABC transporter ATP-binding protein [Oceanispirochaeta sp. M1]
MSDKPILEIQSISKEFSGVTVLDGINLPLRRGEILGLIGENGAGKSTLIKIINGIYTPSGGSLSLNGETIQIKDAQAAKRHGIAMVPQEFNLVDSLNVFENIFLGSELRKKNGLLNKTEMRTVSRSLLSRLETEISVESMISSLSVAEKQMVEVSKALVHDAKILIFDEPTTTLTHHEINILFDLMNRLRDDGVTMIFVSHKLKEVKTICDRVAVLRDGVLVSVSEIDLIDEHQMAQKMVGRELSTIFPPKSTPDMDEEVLSVRGLDVENKLSNINLSLKKGEILGLAGLVGAGRTEFAEAVMGLRSKKSGTISIKGQEVEITSPRKAIENKLGYISEDRQGRGIHTSFDLLANTTLISLKQYTNILLDKKKIQDTASKYVELFKTKTASLKTELQYLSGGNQQKVYLSKWMDTEPEILILDEPTRGIDINAKSEIYQFINQLTEQGFSLIVISSELEEIIGLCTRVYVLREGKIAGELTGEQINEEEIMFYATGVKVMEQV